MSVVEDAASCAKRQTLWCGSGRVWRRYVFVTIAPFLLSSPEHPAAPGVTPTTTARRCAVSAQAVAGSYSPFQFVQIRRLFGELDWCLRSVFLGDAAIVARAKTLDKSNHTRLIKTSPKGLNSENQQVAVL